MFRTILLPVDVSERKQNALDAAARLAEGPGVRVQLLHVIETIPDVPEEEIEDFYAELSTKARKLLGEWAAELERRGVGEVEHHVTVGQRVPDILRYADENGCELIIMTSHQMDREDPTRGLGTISHQIALLAPCAVLLLR